MQTIQPNLKYILKKGTPLVSEGTVLTADASSGALVRGAKTPELVRFSLPTAGALFFHPDDVEQKL